MDVKRQTARGIRRLAATAVAIVAVAATAVPAAFAGVTPWQGAATAVKTACESQTVVRPFVPWADLGSYVFAPNGGFESGLTGWQTTGAAAVVDGNEPFLANSRIDTKALSLPVGATVTTPALCVGMQYPYSRLFASAPAGATLKVELLLVDGRGTAQTFGIGALTGSGTWAPSKKIAAFGTPIALLSSLSTTSGGLRYSAIAYRFTAQGGTWLIDDLFVDPFKLR